MFKNKNILITGASSGIGEKIATDVSLNNGHAFLVARNEKKLIKITNELKKNNLKSSYILADFKNTNDIKKLSDQLPNLSGIVINAGIIDYAPVKFISYDSMIETFNVNFFSNVLLIKNLLKKNKINKNASIVFIGSISSYLGTPATSIYASSKAALTTFSKVLASELIPKKIRVNTVSPGLVNTDLIKNISKVKDIFEKYPLGIGQVEDVSNQVMFLLSEKSKWITGTNIKIDGGYFLE